MGEILNKAHQVEKDNAQGMLDIILTSLKYLSHQGLVLHGDVSDESNLVQFLHLQAEDDPLLLNWWKKPANKIHITR